VLDVIGVLYTLGHTAVTGDSLGRASDRSTAIGLARAAVAMWPDEAEAVGLLALLLLTEARHDGRTTADGALTTLRTADRTRWRRDLIEEGLALSTRVLRTRGRYALQSGIAGLHGVARTWEQTDWTAIVSLYDRLVERWPAPSALLARAIASAHGPGGPAVGLAALDELERSTELSGSAARQLAAARAELLRLAGRAHEARAAFRLARTLEGNATVRLFLTDRMHELGL
jgi:RNA polymerase sigma-70 factor (ECF subfamily)